MNATNASTKSSPKNEKCSPLSLFKRQNATNAYCTQCRTQANALAGPPWAFLLLADIRNHLPSSFTQITSKSLSDFSSTAKVEQIGSISSQPPLSPTWGCDSRRVRTLSRCTTDPNSCHRCWHSWFVTSALSPKVPPRCAISHMHQHSHHKAPTRRRRVHQHQL